jgi:hypothetical protein
LLVEGFGQVLESCQYTEERVSKFYHFRSWTSTHAVQKLAPHLLNFLLICRQISCVISTLICLLQIVAQLIKIEASILNKLRLNATNDRSMHVCPLGILVFFDFSHLKLNEFLVISFNNLCFSYLNSPIFSNFTFIYYEGHAHPRHGNGESLILLIT